MLKGPFANLCLLTCGGVVQLSLGKLTAEHSVTSPLFSAASESPVPSGFACHAARYERKRT